MGLGRNDNYQSANEGPMRDNINVIKDVQGDSLTCLKLGKQQHFGDAANPAKVINPVAGDCVYKKLRALPASTAQPPRCQVEGCNVVLATANANVKEYHKRHKVCERPSKAPKVLVLGIEQRFCQQCSR